MPKLVNAIPKYRKHASGQAVVTIGGKDTYLGKAGTKASKQKYARVVAEWLASDRSTTPISAPGEITISEVCAAFLRHAKQHYVKNGQITDEVASYKVLLSYLKRLYGKTIAAEFGPKGLKAIRETMVAAGNSRNYINKQTVRLKHLFKWAAAEELAPAEVYHRLTVVSGLQKGKTVARENEPVEPVEDSTVEATVPHMRPVIRAMVQFERLTGARPDEVCIMRPCDIDRSGEIWTYRPESHKTEHKGRSRTIYIGPKAQEILRPYLFGDDLPCFRSPRSPKGLNTRSFRDRIHYACDRAFPPPTPLAGEPLKVWQSSHRWCPNQLRHAAATEIRARFGLEAAQVTLGHSRADVTQVYAERDQSKGIAVAKAVG